MAKLELKPDGYFTFDLGRGVMSYSEDGDRLVAFPLSGLLGVLTTSIDRIPRTVPHTVGRHLGEQCGRRLVQAVGEDALGGEMTPERFLDHLNAVLALHGLGTVSFSTWGDILFVDWSLSIEAPDDRSLPEFQEGVLSGLLGAVTDESFEAAFVDEEEDTARFVVGSAAMVDWTKLWMGEGLGLGEIVDRLHSGRHLQEEIEA